MVYQLESNKTTVMQIAPTVILTLNNFGTDGLKVPDYRTSRLDC